MRCTNHRNRAAVAVCTWCGRGICQRCAITTDSRRQTCSCHCARQITRADDLQTAIEQQFKTLTDVQVSLLFVSGVGFAAFAFALLPVGILPVVLLSGVLALACIVAGVLWWRKEIACRRSLQEGDKR